MIFLRCRRVLFSVFLLNSCIYPKLSYSHKLHRDRIAVMPKIFVPPSRHSFASRWFFFNREKYKSRRIQEQEARLMSLSSPESVEFTRQNCSTSKGSQRKETKIRRNVRHGFQFLFLSLIPLFFTRR